MNPKKIMILAGGNDQAELIEELRRQLNGDVYIYLIDMNPNAKAVPYADEFLQISTMDRELVLKAAKEKHIDMILTACGDQPLSTMVYVSEQLNLPCYLNSKLVKELTNKKYMKKRMLDLDIPSSKHIVLKEGQDLTPIENLCFPLVVKPVDSNGSKGVKKVETKEELEESMKEALRFSLSGDIIVEEFNEGPEISIDVYIENGVAKLLSVIELNKIKENKSSFTILQSNFPPSFDYNPQKIVEIAQKIADGYGLKNTPLLIQAIYTDKGLRIIEFSARMGGGSKFKSIKHYSGVDIMKTYVSMVLGDKPHVEPDILVNYASMCYVYCNPGIYESINGLDNAKRYKYIDFYFTYKIPGSEIIKSDTSSDRVAGFMVSGKTKEEVNDKIHYVDNAIKVIDKNGKDIMKHDIYRTI